MFLLINSIRASVYLRSAFNAINWLAIKPPIIATMVAEHAAIVVNKEVKSYILLPFLIPVYHLE